MPCTRSHVHCSRHKYASFSEIRDVYLSYPQMDVIAIYGKGTTLNLDIAKIIHSFFCKVNHLVCKQKPKPKGTVPIMSYSGAEETLKQFVIELYLQTQGDPSKTVSWYDIGEMLGLNREGSSQAAEEIIGTGLAEIKSLNGGITITGDGIDEAQKLGAGL